MRSLFTGTDELVMVGYDASGLENRMLADAMNDPELTKIILGEGDVDFHTFVWRQIEEFVHSKDNAKALEYAVFYGASDNKLGTMVDYKPSGWSTKKVGSEVRRRLMRGLPALDDLTQRISRMASEKGYVLGPDRRRLFCRSPHSALNVKLQGGGAIVMKTALAFMIKWLRKEDLYYDKVIDMHDECEWLTFPNQADRLGELGVKSIVKAGEYLNLNCPLDAEYKIGSNWAEVH